MLCTAAFLQAKTNKINVKNSNYTTSYTTAESTEDANYYTAPELVPDNSSAQPWQNEPIETYHAAAQKPKQSPPKNNFVSHKKIKSYTPIASITVEDFYANSGANNAFFEERNVPNREYTSYFEGNQHNQLSLQAAYYFSQKSYIIAAYDRVVSSDGDTASADNYSSGDGNLRINDKTAFLYVGGNIYQHSKVSADLVFGLQYADFKHKSITNYYRYSVTPVTLYGESYSNLVGVGPVVGFGAKYKFNDFANKLSVDYTAFFNADAGVLFSKIKSQFYSYNQTSQRENNAYSNDTNKLVPYFKFRLGLESKWNLNRSSYIAAQIGYQFKYYQDATRGLSGSANDIDKYEQFDRINFYGPFLNLTCAW